MENSLRIDYQCPQCGAPVVIEETDRLFTCGFCRVRIVFNPGEQFRYCLQVSGDTPADDVFYIPFWRFKGMYFNCVPFEVKGKIMDATFPSLDLDFMPPNLGYRTQTHPLRMASSSLGRGFLAPRTRHEDVLALVESRTHYVDVMNKEPGSLFKAYVGEVTSLIYTPVYIRNRAIYDGIINRPLGRYSVERQPVFESAPSEPGWKFQFVPALCPGCGWDLQGERDSVVLNCPNCETAWRMADGAFTRIEYGTVEASTPGSYLLPFWVMRFSFEGAALETYADLVRLANLPRAVQTAWETQALQFWTPAFRVAPSPYGRISKQFTLLQPNVVTTPSMPRSGVHPVTLGASDAARGVLVILGNMAVAKQRLLPRLADIRPRLEEARLIYLPFEIHGQELQHPGTDFTIPLNAFRGHPPALR